MKINIDTAGDIIKRKADAAKAKAQKAKEDQKKKEEEADRIKSQDS